MVLSLFVVLSVTALCSAAHAQAYDPLSPWRDAFESARPLDLADFDGEEICLINPAGSSQPRRPTVGIYINGQTFPALVSSNGFSVRAECFDIVSGLHRTAGALSHGFGRGGVDRVNLSIPAWRRTYRQRGNHIIVRSEVITGDGTVLTSYESANLEHHRVSCTCGVFDTWPLYDCAGGHLLADRRACGQRRWAAVQ